MNLRTWLIRKKVVKAVIYQSDKRIKTYYQIPKDNTITINKKTFIINDDDFYLDKDNIPTYLYQHNSTEPINPHDLKKSVLTPDYYNTAINSHVARDIFEATKGGMDLATLSLVVSVITLAVSGIGLYMVYKNLGEISQQVNKINEMIKLIGGITE